MTSRFFVVMEQICILTVVVIIYGMKLQRNTHTHTHRDTQIAHAKANEIQVRCAPWSTASHQGQSCGFDN